MSPVSHSESKPLLNPYTPPLSVQLWSVKETLKADFAKTLAKLSAMGFKGVEFANEYGPYKNNPTGLKTLLDSLNLTASSAHISFEELNDQHFEQTVNFFKKLGVSILIIGWDERAWQPSEVNTVVALLNQHAKALAKHQMQIGFHNHAQEFKSFNGTTYWDHIALNTYDNVILQLDVGWASYAGKDPANYIKRYPNRTKVVHFKSRIPKGITGKLPIIGKDTIDWNAVLTSCLEFGGTQWIVLEQEEYPNGLSQLEALSLSKQGFETMLNNRP